MPKNLIRLKWMMIKIDDIDNPVIPITEGLRREQVELYVAGIQLTGVI